MIRKRKMQRTKAAVAAPDWAEGLPPELLGCVLDRVTAAGHARFASVCTSWRSAVKEAGNPRRPLPAQAPWVLISTPFETDIGDAHDSFTFVRPSDGKVHTVHPKLPPDFHWKRLAGISPDGCIILVNKYRHPELRAFNPLTGARLRLPRVRTIPKGYPKQCAKVAMSSPGLGGAGPAVFMALFHNGRQNSAVAVANAGDKKWSLLDTVILTHIYDVAYHEGAFYVLGRTGARDFNNEGLGLLCIAIVHCGGAGHHLSSPPEIMVVGPKRPWEFDHFLVWSESGDLLLVVSTGYYTYKVFRLDFLPDAKGGRKIVRSMQLGDLGDQALLLGRKCSMLVSTMQVPELKKNCVYSIFNHRQRIFSLEDGSEAFGAVPFGSCIAAAWFFPSVI